MMDKDEFLELIEAATMAPSSDNMQPWAFRPFDGGIEVYIERARLLAIDIMDMFSWISIGAAMQNITEAARARGYSVTLRYPDTPGPDDPSAILYLAPQGRDTDISGPAVPDGTLPDSLSPWIPRRTTNRRAFGTEKISASETARLSEYARGTEAKAHWLREGELESLIALDELCSAVLLEHEPLFNGLFDTIRFTRGQMLRHRCGMDVNSLDIPPLAAFVAKGLRGFGLSRAISRFGFGPGIAKGLSARLREAGGICLVSCDARDRRGFMEAGRAMERIWLAATAAGYAAHPFGVIPQYLTIADLKPAMFPPGRAGEILSRAPKFRAAFGIPEGLHPVIMLRIGVARELPPRTSARFLPETVCRSL